MPLFEQSGDAERTERALLIRLLMRLLAEQQMDEQEEDDDEIPMVRTHVEPLGGA